MKPGHYYNQAEKAFKILDAFHSKMFELGGEESDHWCDELNHNQRILDQALTWGKEEELFVDAAKFDEKIKFLDNTNFEYLEQIKILKDKINFNKKIQNRLKEEKKEYLKENNMDYKTIEKRLENKYPDLINS
jgi:ribose 5-phosphate isomerase RpiB